jgi:hypothetical protein
MMYGRTVTVFREVRDDFGDVTVQDERDIPGCAWWPRTSVEDFGGGSTLGGSVRTGASTGAVQVSTGLTMMCPPGAGITATHRVRLPDDTVWVVVGAPGAWQSPLSGWMPGDTVELEQTTG